VYWLPIELVKPESTSVERQESVDARAHSLHLPCPTMDLFRFMASIGVGEFSASISNKKLHRVLRRSPALILFSLSRFHLHYDRGPDSAKELLEWCQENLAGCIAEHAQQRQVDGGNTGKEFSYAKLHKFFKTFLIARTNRQLRLSLARFVRINSRLKKDVSMELVNRLVGKRISAKDFKCKKIHRIEMRQEIVDDWTVQFGNVDIRMLLRHSILASEKTRDFEARLQAEKLASMKQLAYGASHEINNPLANISTRAQTMLAVETDHEKRHKLAVIYEQAIRAHEMISDMMLFAHPPAISTTRVAARLMVNRLLHELKPVLLDSNSIEVLVTFGPGVDFIEVDVTQISVAVKNLMMNSIEAIRSKSGRGRVEVRLDRTETDLEISVWDNGLKIGDEVRRHLFDPFYSGREAGRGLGFGLSKVWAIARLHGGKIEFDDLVKFGTRFVLRLPQSPLGSNRADSSAKRSTIILRENAQVIEEDAA